MASSFDRWEKDPFFNAAEEVQESADRMESAYRTWIRTKKDASSPWNLDELRRDVHTALGTAKWQLDEFQRAVSSSYYGKSSSEDAINRHRNFISAIEDKITKIQHSLNESVHSGGKASLPWLRLDEGERNELALFLSGMPAAGGNSPIKCNNRGGSENLQPSDKDTFSNRSDTLGVSSGWDSSEAMEVKSQGHRRTASADADIGSWKIAVSGDVQDSANGSSGPMHKVASLAGYLSSMDSISKLKWPKNGYRKLQTENHHQETDNALLPSTQFDRGIVAHYGKNKSYLDSRDECYYKQLYGWYGAIQRQLQRSQYQMQYSRPVQITVRIVILLCLIALIAFCAM